MMKVTLGLELIYKYELSMTTGSYLEMHQSDLSEIIVYIATNNMD